MVIAVYIVKFKIDSQEAKEFVSELKTIRTFIFVIDDEHHTSHQLLMSNEVSPQNQLQKDPHQKK